MTAKAQSSDVCFRCHKQGHWAIDCPEGHEPEWLAKQNCYLCGKKGHLKVACPNKIKTDDQFKTKLKQNKPPVVKPAWYQTGTSLVKLLGNLSVKSLDDFQYYKSISSENSSNLNDPKFYKQRSSEWLNAHKGKINGSKAATALGWFGKKAMNDYWNDLSNDLHAVTKEGNESNLAMLWGSINEDSALVTYLKSFLGKKTDNVIVRETGIWLLNDKNNQSWLGSSPDGIIEFDGKRKTVLEIKCPFMGGKPVPYKNVCVNHIPQIMLEMFCTSTQECHYVVWTPVGTKVFVAERDDSYIELLLNQYLYKFWNLACDEIQPPWHEDVFGLKQKK